MRWSALCHFLAPLRRHHRRSGYSLLEIMTIVAILGTMAAIATPSYLGWANRLRLSAAQQQVMMAMKRAQHKATKTLVPQQISFRETTEGKGPTAGHQVEWSIHPIDTQPIAWEALPPEIKLDPETSLRQKDKLYVMQFNERGEANGQLGRVTITLPNDPHNKRCVIVSTLLGAMRSGTSHPKPNEGKYCY
jgi:Tfp pilus assembly protein FimT